MELFLNVWEQHNLQESHILVYHGLCGLKIINRSQPRYPRDRELRPPIYSMWCAGCDEEDERPILDFVTYPFKNYGLPCIDCIASLTEEHYVDTR